MAALELPEVGVDPRGHTDEAGVWRTSRCPHRVLIDVGGGRVGVVEVGEQSAHQNVHECALAALGLCSSEEALERRAPLREIQAAAILNAVHKEYASNTKLRM